MQILISFLTFLLTLVGLDPQPGTTTLSVSSVDGVQVNSTKSVVNGGDARFECLRSASGRCHYVVFASQCRGVDAARQRGCPGVVVERFVLQAGQSREFRSVPGKLSYCMDHHQMPAGPGCLPG